MTFKIVKVTIEHFECEAEDQEQAEKTEWNKTARDSITTHIIPTIPAPIQPEPWPVVLLPLKLMAKEGDRGAGDIIARVIGPIGGEAFKVWYKATFGKDCGCGNRQDALNRRWPL